MFNTSTLTNTRLSQQHFLTLRTGILTLSKHFTPCTNVRAAQQHQLQWSACSLRSASCFQRSARAPRQTLLHMACLQRLICLKHSHIALRDRKHTGFLSQTRFADLFSLLFLALARHFASTSAHAPRFLRGPCTGSWARPLHCLGLNYVTCLSRVAWRRAR